MYRYSRIVCFIGALALFGFGCRGLSQTEQQAIRPVTVDYWTVYEDIDMLRQFASEYQQFRPYVNINIRRVREDQFDDLFVNALADDVSPDIVSISVRELPKYRSRLARMPASVQVANVFVRGGLSQETVVEPVVNAMPTLNTVRRSYINAVVDGAVRGNTVYGLPLAVDTMALYVNRDLLDAAGVPELPENWDEFVETVKDVTRYDDAGRVVQSGVAMGTVNNIPNALDLLAILWMQNGLPLDERGISSLSVANLSEVPNHPTFQTLRFFSDFARSDRDVYTWDESLSTARNEFIRGRSVFYFGYAYERADIDARAPQLDYEIIPIPQLDPTNPKNITNFAIQSVSEKSDAPNEAWDFIRYITQAQNVERYLGATMLPTPLRSQVTAQAGVLEMQPFLQGILTATNWYQGEDYAAATNALGTLINRYVRPLTEDQDRNERDALLLDTFIRTVQQSQ